MKSDWKAAYRPSHDVVTAHPGSSEYPAAVSMHIRKPPVLFMRGNLQLLSHPHILAIVGSRRLSMNNEASLCKILENLHDTSIAIMSGLALGIDGLAHTRALANALPTIAVVGSSIEWNELYPRSHIELARRIIAENGLIISPFPPGTPTLPHNFPARNQIIAALAHSVLVASAAHKSGALITAKHALDYGKDVLAIPGSICDPLFDGCNEIIRDGATPVLETNDINAHFALPRIKTQPVKLTSEEQKIVSILDGGDVTINELSVHIGKPVYELATITSSLELKGVASIEADGTIRLTH